jgi:hypothetical protein
MTGAEWQSCTDPRALLEHLGGGASDRKLRLFACACCRRIWHLLDDERSRRAVAVSERIADGLAGDAEGEPAGAAAGATGDVTSGPWSAVAWRAGTAAEWALPPPEDRWQLRAAWEYAAQALEGECLLAGGATQEMLDAWSAECAESGRVQGWTGADPDAVICDILRDLFHPDRFHQVRTDPAWIVRNDGAVQKLAEAVYEGRSFDRLPILADALEEAGCDDAELLGHLRGPGPHVRGCWALDLVRSVD